MARRGLWLLLVLVGGMLRLASVVWCCGGFCRAESLLGGSLLGGSLFGGSLFLKHGLGWYEMQFAFMGIALVGFDLLDDTQKYRAWRDVKS